jgi:hypothetical protein
MTILRLPLLVALAAGLAGAAAGCKKDPPPAPAAPPPAAEPAPAAPPPAPAAPAAVAGRVEVTITEEGFVPSRIPAKAGQPLVLAITRKAERTCATEILFHGQEGKTDLPLNKTVEVTYVPKSSGPVKFGCAMGMMIGGVIDVSP